MPIQKGVAGEVCYAGLPPSTPPWVKAADDARVLLEVSGAEAAGDALQGMEELMQMRALDVMRHSPA
jgi:hypothetical protein